MHNSSNQSNDHDQSLDHGKAKTSDVKNLTQQPYNMMYPSYDQLPYDLAVNIASTINPGMIPYANLRYTTKKDTLRKGKWTVS
jgi:hypothetical protein